MKSLPPTVRAYRQTPVFSEGDVPAGLLAEHTTKSGTWARIVVLEGVLRYRIFTPVPEEVRLTPHRVCIVEPGVVHSVLPLGAVRFYVEFLREDNSTLSAGR